MRNNWYDKAWFETQAEPSARSARALVPHVFETLGPRSVVDYGCGTGTWLAAMSEAGVEEVRGVDGSYIDRAQLHIPPEHFSPMDLREPASVGSFDLAICLEVGEHLPASAAAPLVETLVGSAPAILFGAAVPGQGGTHHINEQWQSYWSELFASHGFQPTDFLRRRFWSDQQVAYYYVQNTLLYTREGKPGDPVELLDVVHPRMVQEPSVRGASVRLARALRSRAGQVVGARRTAG